MNETPFVFFYDMVLLQVVLAITQTTKTPLPAIFGADDIASDGMHIIMSAMYVFLLHIIETLYTLYTNTRHGAGTRFGIIVNNLEIK